MFCMAFDNKLTARAREYITDYPKWEYKEKKNVWWISFYG